MEAQLYDNELEQHILGSLLNGNAESIEDVREYITPEHFYAEFHQQVYKVICQLVDEGVEPTIMAVSEKMRILCGDPKGFELAELSNHGDLYVKTTLMQHIGILTHYYKRRKLWMLGCELKTWGSNVEDDMDSIIEHAKSALDNIDKQAKDEDLTMSEVLNSLSQRIANNRDGVKNGDITYTGFPYIDKNGGLESGTLIIIGATSSMGKTSLADSLALRIIQNEPVAFYSLEMTPERIAARLLSSVSKVNAQRLYSEKLEYYDNKSVEEGLRELGAYASNLIFPRTQRHTLTAITRSIRRQHKRQHIKGAIVDYIQLISGETSKQNREQFVGECAHTFQALAKELNIWIIVLSQLNRVTSGQNPVPSADTLRDSGQIREAADVIYLIYRPQLYNDTEGKSLTYPAPFENVRTDNTAMIIAAKNRNGTVGKFICGFDADTTSFYPISLAELSGENNDEPFAQPKQDEKLPF